MASETLLTCPSDIFMTMTQYLEWKDVHALLQVDKSSMRSKLVEEGGVSQLIFKALDNFSFPYIVFQFPRLSVLDVDILYRRVKSFPVGLLLSLPPNLKDLRLHFEQAQNCWLQPACVPGNNDDAPFEQFYKPIYIDKLLPKLKRLALYGTTWETFTPIPGQVTTTTHSALADNEVFTQNCKSILKDDVKQALDSNMALKLPLTWTPKMRWDFLSHLPRDLEHLHLSVLPIVGDTNLLDALPPHMYHLSWDGPASGSRMGKIPETLRSSLRHLSIRPTSESFDGPFPPNLTELTVHNSYYSIPLGIIPDFPLNLTSLTVNNHGQWGIHQLPPKLTFLSLSHSSSIDDSLVAFLPSTIRTLHVSGSMNWSNFAFPEGLTALRLQPQNAAWFDDNVAMLPRGLRYLDIDSSSHIGESALLLLPQKLETLKLGKCGERINDQSIECLPRSILELSINTSLITTKSTPHFPPKITSLVLEYVSLADSFILGLPSLPSLTHLRCGGLRATGRLVPPGTTTITSQILTESVKAALPAAVVENKNSAWAQRYMARPNDYRNELTMLPDTVTTIDLNYGPLVMESCSITNGDLPNLIHLTITENFDFPAECLCLLTHLQLLRLPKHSKLPGETFANMNSLHTLELGNLISGNQVEEWTNLPLSLTDLKLEMVPPDSLLIKRLVNLKKLTLLNGYSYGVWGLTGLPPQLETLEIIGMRTTLANNLSNLPSSLTSLILPGCNMADHQISKLPSSIISLKLQTIMITDVYDVPQNKEEFNSPKVFFELLTIPERSSLVAPHIAKLEVVNYEVSLDSMNMCKMIGHPKSITLASDHARLSDQFTSFLPSSVTFLDMILQTTGLSNKCMLTLPPLLETLLVSGKAWTEIGPFNKLPETLTRLEITKATGRLNPEEAKSLPIGLKKLRLGPCLVDDKAVACLPPNLTDIEFPNSVRITDLGVKTLPRSVTRLSLSTARLSPACLDFMPPNLSFLNLGTGSTVSAVHVLNDLHARKVSKPYDLPPTTVSN